TIICSKENLGFAGGNNLGIGKAKGDYLFFLNNDTVITKPVLSVLVECLQRDPNIGCVSPKTTFWPEYTV
ncbi:glycosyltransferase, partial [Extibacter sp. GGCC_0201]